jgi:hypothetical protein
MADERRDALATDEEDVEVAAAEGVGDLPVIVRGLPLEDVVLVDEPDVPALREVELDHVVNARPTYGDAAGADRRVEAVRSAADQVLARLSVPSSLLCGHLVSI